jgi:hypothetical protein
MERVTRGGTLSPHFIWLPFGRESLPSVLQAYLRRV